MDISTAKNFPLDSLRDSFRSYLRTKGYNENTVGNISGYVPTDKKCKKHCGYGPTNELALKMAE